MRVSFLWNSYRSWILRALYPCIYVSGSINVVVDIEQADVVDVVDVELTVTIVT